MSLSPFTQMTGCSGANLHEVKLDGRKFVLHASGIIEVEGQAKEVVFGEDRAGCGCIRRKMGENLAGFCVAGALDQERRLAPLKETFFIGDTLCV